MNVLVDLVTQKIIAFPYPNTGAVLPPGQVLVEAPEDFDSSVFSRYYYTEGSLARDDARWINEFKTARIERIKEEATKLLEATDWTLQRAREREEAGWTALSMINELLAARESIRKSSDRAEAEVLLLEEPNDIISYRWEVIYDVPTPRRVTRQAFLALFTNQETEAIFTAAKAAPLIEGWLMRVQAAQYVNLDDPATVMGVQGMVLAGLLTEARAAEVLS